MIDPSTTLRELAVQVPGATSIFEEHRLDYCCRGARSLADACTAAGVPLDRVLPRLEAAATQPTSASVRWEARALDELVRHIVDDHHAYTRSELDRLAALAAKVEAVHGAAHPELATVRALIAALDDDLRPHLSKEERILFPYILELATASRAGRARPVPPFGTVRNPVRMMMLEHDHAGDLLARLRAATNDYAAPASACGSYRALYAGLAALEKDLHEHIHLESNVLFPRAIAIEVG